MITIPAPDVYTPADDEPRAIVPDGECLSYVYAREYDQTAAARVRKYKPGKDMGDADDNLAEPQ